MANTSHQQVLMSFGLAEALEEGCSDSKTLTSSDRGKYLQWNAFVKDPSKWWDNGNSKPSPRYLDLKHQVTVGPIWLVSWYTQSWVIEEFGNGGEPCLGAALSGNVFHLKSEIDAFLASLRACTRNKDLARGTSIHNELVQRGLLQKCSHALVIMYAKCGELRKAKELLDMYESSGGHVVTWTAVIAGYAQEGHGQNALDCFEQMKRKGIRPDAVTYAYILKACAAVGTGAAADKGEEIHDDIVTRGLLQNDVVLGNALVDMYAKCGDVSRARQVLDKLPLRDVVSWSALIAGYTQQGLAEQALDCFEEMQCEGILPDAVTYVCILKACAMMRAVERGKQLHDEIARQGLLQHHTVLGGALVDMYVKCGAVSKAREVLDGLPSSRNVVSWNALIAGYTQEGHAEQALNCFEEMQWEGILPDAVTYLCILKACAAIRAADKGKQIHDEIARRQGFLLQNHVVLGGALVDMYAKCGALSKAQQVLNGMPSRDVVSWSALIAGYVQEGDAEQALSCFDEMVSEGILPNAVTYACTLKACAMIEAAADRGKRIHDDIVRQGLLQKHSELGGALVNMYAKWGAVSQARQVLDGLPSRDVVSWSALILGYTEGGDTEQALHCFEEMRREGILPDPVTYVCVLKACSMIRASSDKGKQIHDEIAREGLLQNSTVLGGALVDMYAKCGAVSKARQVLEGLPSRNVVSWSALIAGYAREGDAEQALDCLEAMQREGILPDVVTCACVLNVCSHRGLVEEGQALFVSMITKYHVNPDLDCYTCMVDLFGRAGHLEKAVRLIQGMPSSDYSIIWHSLLGACRNWADANVGRWAFGRAVRLDKSDGSAYVLMASIYARAGMAQKAEVIEAMRIRNRAWWKPGCSGWIDSSTMRHGLGQSHTSRA